jgi:hypothetical protein
VAGSCEYGDEPSGSGATKLVIETNVVMVTLTTDVSPIHFRRRTIL